MKNAAAQEATRLRREDAAFPVYQHFVSEEKGFRLSLSAKGASLIIGDSLADQAARADLIENMFARAGVNAPAYTWYKPKFVGQNEPVLTQGEIGEAYKARWEMEKAMRKTTVAKCVVSEASEAIVVPNPSLGKPLIALANKLAAAQLSGAAARSFVSPRGTVSASDYSQALIDRVGPYNDKKYNVYQDICTNLHGMFGERS